MQDLPQLQYLIATTLLKGIGIKKAKELIAHCGGAEAVFNAKKKSLSKIPGIGSKGLNIFSSQNKKSHLVSKVALFLFHPKKEANPLRVKYKNMFMGRATVVYGQKFSQETKLNPATLCEMKYSR